MMTTTTTARDAPLQGQEEKDVRRVFEFLAGYALRRIHREKKKPLLLEHEEELEPDLLSTLNTRSVEEPTKPVEQRVMTVKDLDTSLRTLGRQCTRKQLEYMIWEVDENLDGVVDWDEFKVMYQRNVNDETGLEPFELFNIVQFMTYLPTLRVDKDFRPQITEDDTMSTLFARYGHDHRYGRVHVERVMSKLFGDKLKAHKGEGVLTLDEYLRVVGVRNYERKRSSCA